MTKGLRKEEKPVRMPYTTRRGGLRVAAYEDNNKYEDSEQDSVTDSSTLPLDIDSTGNTIIFDAEDGKIPFAIDGEDDASEEDEIALEPDPEEEGITIKKTRCK